jgi:hypothetical protein
MTDKKRHDDAPNAGRRELALAALIAGQTRAEAAEAVGISKRTLERWAADPTFKAELAEGRRAAYADALGVLKGRALAAVETLGALLKSRNEAIRKQAATELLSFALKAHETGELEERMAAIERHAVGLGHRLGARPF